MNVVFRVDASARTGVGHVMRCLALACALRERGVNVFFVCREHDGGLCDFISHRGFEVRRLPAPSVGSQADKAFAHAASLGATWQEDAEQVRAIINALGFKPDWLVVDHYAIDQRWECILRMSVERIMVIDDLADRIHDCDLLLDQNLQAQMLTRYRGKVPVSCGLLVGPEYALLQPIYVELRDRTVPRRGPIQRVLIFFSGADSCNLTGRTLGAFLSFNRSDIEVDVVTTATYPYADSLRRQAIGHGNIHLHSDLPTLAPLMAVADLAIGAGGATSWERLCMGLPALVVTLADNQLAVADELSQRGLILWLGHHNEVNEQAIAQALGKLLQQGLEEDWSLRCRATVDGHGANRVCAALTITVNTPLQVRYARLDDEALLLSWANDLTTRSNSFSPAPIPEASHRDWFRTRLRNQAGCRLYIVETIEGIALGQVRFERQGQAWEVDYGLAPVFRRRGLGRPVLEAALLKLDAGRQDSLIIVGHVKNGNFPSRKVFESLGFDAQLDEVGGAVAYQRVRVRGRGKSE